MLLAYLLVSSVSRLHHALFATEPMLQDEHGDYRQCNDRINCMIKAERGYTGRDALLNHMQARYASARRSCLPLDSSSRYVSNESKRLLPYKHFMEYVDNNMWRLASLLLSIGIYMYRITILSLFMSVCPLCLQ